MRARGVQPVLWPPGLHSAGFGRPPCLLVAPADAGTRCEREPPVALPRGLARGRGAGAGDAGDGDWSA
eukprot:12286941-Alexandrium_andersonii.AAC.1